MNSLPPTPAPARGPAEHERREQIIRAAGEHFRHYGYGKTSVADLARAIGVSTAYIYKFFESKQDIGVAVCSNALGSIGASVIAVAQSDGSATARLREVFKVLKDMGLELFFEERRLHDLAVTSCTQRWPSTQRHRQTLEAAVRHLVLAGRESGEFERKTPLDEVCAAILDCMAAFSNPLLLEQKTPEQLDASVLAVSNLVLRSLAI